MSSLIERWRASREPEPERGTVDELLAQVSYLGQNYPLGLQFTGDMNDDTEAPLPAEFVHNVRTAYQQGGPVFACIVARSYLFTEARFQWQQIDNGRPGELFGTPSLRLLEQPWPRGTTGDLLARAEQDVSLAGNFWVQRDRGRLWRLRPDYMTIVLGSQLDAEHPSEAPDAEEVGAIFKAPNGRPYFMLPEQYCHWAPIPDPLATYRGMSWVGPLYRDVDADNLAVLHKGNFFRKAATVNLVVLPDVSVGFDEFIKFKDSFTEDQAGAINAYKTLFLGAGSKVEKVGLSMKDMDYKGLMGISETRIAAAANVPPIIAGFSEGLASATYSNYGMARRKFGDHYARPQWRSFAGSIQHLLDPPPRGDLETGSVRLWYDDRDIPFLREDTGEEAKIRQTDAVTLNQLIQAGYKPDAATEYVSTGNVSVLEGQHTGLASVQLVPLGAPIDEGEPATNGASAEE